MGTVASAYPHAQVQASPEPAVSEGAEQPRAPGIAQEEVDAVFARRRLVGMVSHADLIARCMRRRNGRIDAT